MPVLKKTMFREYDIRGRESADEMNDASVYHIARGMGALLRANEVNEIVVGNDARGTSESFRNSAIRALVESGISVVNIGTVTTPMSYWAQYNFNVPGLFMITASHNPVGWNGVKLGMRVTHNLSPEESDTLYDLIRREAYVTGASSVRTEDIRERYMQDLLSRVRPRQRRRVLVNTGNGTAGLYAPELIGRAGYEVVERYTELDPTYPHYTANPDGAEMMEDTGRATVASACDIGLAFDGDGDRLGVTDEKGNTVWPDRYLILLSRLVLAKRPGAKIIFDVKVSEALPEDIVAHGGVPVMCKTGRTHIRERTMKEHAVLGGEMSGHVFFNDGFYGFDDGFFAALKLLEYVSNESQPLSALVASTPYYVSTPTLSVAVPDEVKFTLADRLTEAFIREGHRVVTHSGARVYMDGGWGLVRASNTTPSLTLRFEAKDVAALARIEDAFKKKLAAEGIKADFDVSGK